MLKIERKCVRFILFVTIHMHILKKSGLTKHVLIAERLLPSTTQSPPKLCAVHKEDYESWLLLRMELTFC